MNQYFRNRRSAERKAEFTRMIQLRPQYVPIILEPHTVSKTLKAQKLLISPDNTVGGLITVIRKQILGANQSIYLFSHDGYGRNLVLLQIQTKISEIEKREDGFLYLLYSNQNSFGF